MAIERLGSDVVFGVTRTSSANISGMITANRQQPASASLVHAELSVRDG